MEATNRGGEVAGRWRGGGIEVAASYRERSHGALGGGRQRVSPSQVHWAVQVSSQGEGRSSRPSCKTGMGMWGQQSGEPPPPPRPSPMWPPAHG